MAFIRVFEEHEATGEIRDVYEALQVAYLTPARRARGTVSLPPIIRVFGLSPALLRARVAFSDTFYRSGSSGLGRRREELIAVCVSSLLGCHACALGHGAFLRRAGLALEDVGGVLADFRAVRALDAVDRAILTFAERLTLSPEAISLADRELLTGVGLDLPAQAAIVLASAYRGFINRVAGLLGVDLATDGPDVELMEYAARNVVWPSSQTAARPARRPWTASPSLFEPLAPEAVRAHQDLAARASDLLLPPVSFPLLRVAYAGSVDVLGHGALAAYTRQGFEAPSQVGPGHLDALRAEGYDDVAILGLAVAIALTPATACLSVCFDAW